MIASVFFAAGAMVGVAHAGLLARAARGAPDLVSMLARISAVAAVLVVAVRAGHLAAGAAGWGLGLAVAGALLHRRLG